MTAIFRGRRYHLISQNEATVCLEQFVATGTRIEVSTDNPDLIVCPTAKDLHLAEAFESGEIAAFEYPDGHTYPPGHEISQPNKPVSGPRPSTRVH